MACHQAEYTQQHAGSVLPTTCGDCHALDTWLVARYGSPKTAALARFSSNDLATEALDSLNRELFASTAASAPANTVDLGKVMQAVELARGKEDADSSPALPALYPTG